jgi:hypothetical protein
MTQKRAVCEKNISAGVFARSIILERDKHQLIVCLIVNVKPIDPGKTNSDAQEQRGSYDCRTGTFYSGKKRSNDFHNAHPLHE